MLAVYTITYLITYIFFFLYRKEIYCDNKTESAIAGGNEIPHCKKSFSIFPSPAGMSLIKLSLVGNYDVIYKLFLPRESLVTDIPAGNGNIEKLFLQCSGCEEWRTDGHDWKDIIHC